MKTFQRDPHIRMDSDFRFLLFVSISTGGFIYTLLSDLKLYNQAMIIKTLIPSGDALDVPFVFLGYLLYGNKTLHIVRFGHLSRP